MKLTSAMMLGEMKVEDAIEDRYNNNSGRLFRRKILEVDNLDEVSYHLLSCYKFSYFAARLYSG